jgi:glutamate/aspartate transport system substrate-binding protein
MTAGLARWWFLWLGLAGTAGAGTATAGATVGTPAGAEAPDSPTLRKIRDTGVIVLGYRVASVPFSYIDPQLKPIGYSMDLCHRVVGYVRQRLALPDLEVKLVALTSATRMPLVVNGTVDMECGVTTNNAERQKTQTFSITTFVAESRLLSKKASQVRTIDDLRGQAVASTIATTSIQNLINLNAARRLDMKILAGADDQDGFRMLRTDRVVAFAMDDVLLRSLLAGVPNADEFTISEEALSTEPYGIGLTRDDPAFKQLVDGVIADVYKRGDIQAIYRQWFQSPIPPKGINLQLPMSESLKRVINHPTDASDPKHYR